MTYMRQQDHKGSVPVTCDDTIDHVPDYLRDTYSWAYLNPKTVPWLSSAPVVAAILWGNAPRLIRKTLVEITPGTDVLQAAAVYGRFSAKLAEAVGEKGSLSVIDIAPIQVETARKRVASYPQAGVWLGDASRVQAQPYDCVVCFFLLHEVPAEVRAKIVPALLASTKPGGKVVFVDYHKPHDWHPLKPVMSKVFDWLEPFAKDLWSEEIQDLAPAGMQLIWHKETLFGGLYQKVVAQRPALI